MPLRCDVAVVGSGPAGAACALRLARAGYAVALIDHKAFPRHKVCGEYLNLGAIRELRDLGIAEVVAADATTLRAMRLYAHDDSAEFRFSSPAWSIPRTVLDDKIRQRALAAGAQPMCGRVRAIRETETAVTLTIGSESGETTLEARYAIGADGMRSTVARLVGLATATRCERFAIGGHSAGGEMDNCIEMYAARDGYLALNPVGASAANAMFVLTDAHLRTHRNDLDAELQRFSAEITRGKRTVRDARFSQARRAIGPLAYRSSAVAQNRVLLVGDAARFVDPFTGQGVFLALAGARTASAAVTRAFADDRVQARGWATYSRELQALLQERERVASFVRFVLGNRFISHRVARVLRRRPADFGAFVEAVCGNGHLGFPQLVTAAKRALC